MAHPLVLGLAGLLLGLLCGSFLNVCISRLPVEESIVTPRSHCRSCGNPVRAIDNVPLLSFLLLRGKCRSCHSAIGWRYPVVELALGIWFALGVLPLSAGMPWSDSYFRLLIHQVAFCTLGFFLIGLMVMDWKHLRLPDAMTIPGVLLGFFLTCADALFLAPGEYDLVLKRRVNINAANSGHSTGNVFLTGPEHLVFGRVFAIAGCFLMLFGIRAVYRLLRKRDGMGLGDAKLLAMIASFAGFAPALLAFFAGTLFAAVYGVVALTRGKATAATRLPFGSFMAVGGLLAALTGASFIDWYLRLLR